MENVYGNWWGGKPLPLDVDENGNGIIDGNAYVAFTRGHCHSLALALHQLTGWPIIGVGVGTRDKIPAHIVVYCPELDDYIDIEGPGARMRLAFMFAAGFTFLQPGDVADLDGYLPPEPDFAKPFAQTLLQSINHARIPVARGQEHAGTRLVVLA